MIERNGPSQPITLTPDQFKRSQHLAGVESAFAFYQVPLDHAIALKAAAFTLRIKGQVLPAAFAASGTATVVVDLAAAGLKIAKSTLSAPAFPTAAHPDAVAFVSDTGAVWTPANITAINYITGQVTVAKLATTTRVKLYYLLGDGEIVLRGRKPSAYDQDARQIYRDSSKKLNELDQVDGRTAPKLTRPQPLISQFRLEIAARTAGLVEWVDEARHEIVIQAEIQRIRITDREAAERATLAALGVV
jgi:hypothetical protein